MRDRGDRRTLAGLAGEFLGPDERAIEPRTLITHLSLGTRAAHVRRRTIFAAAAAAVLLIATPIVLHVTRTNDAGIPVLHVIGPDSGPVLRVQSVPIDGQRWTARTPLDPEREATSTVEFARGLMPPMPVVRPGAADQWIVQRAFADSGGQDLVLVRDGREHRLTDSPGDDQSPDWSPDGSLIVFETARWNPLSHYDLAITDPASDATWPLVRGDSVYASPKWSPDGTRIAYRRTTQGRTAEDICWIPLDGRQERCHTGRHSDGRLQLTDWLNDRSLLLLTEGDDVDALVVLDVEDGSLRNITPPVAASRVERAAVVDRWLALESRDGGTRTWWVYPVARPDLARAVRFDGGDASAFSLQWGGTPHYLERLEIDLPERGIPAEVPFVLHVTGRDNAGEPLEPRALDFHVSDTSIAEVLRSGILLPRAPGTATLSVSAGGWREASAILHVVDPSSANILSERWTDDWLERWRPFGDPAPALADGPEGIRGFWNNGDGSHPSGAYTLEAFPTADGLGVEVALAASVIATQWHELSVSLVATDDAELAEWDHVTGYLPGYLRTAGAAPPCTFEFPAGTPDVQPRTMRVGTALIGLPDRGQGDRSDYGNGAWFTAVLQLFPDGTCGLAIDGVPVARSTQQVVRGDSMRVVLGLASKGTLNLHGPLEVWTGVRRDVEWAALVEGR
jgi:hypothetical protein